NVPQEERRFCLPYVEDLVYQVEHKDAKKSNEMYYPRDDQMFTTIKLVSRHQNTQKFSAILPIELTNEDIRSSAAYKEYYTVASGAVPPKTKASVRNTQSCSDTIITPPTAACTRLSTLEKGKQPAKSSKVKGVDKGTGSLPGVLDVPTDEPDEEISWKSSDEDDDDDEVDDRSDDQEDYDDQDDDDQDDNNDDQDTNNDSDDFVHPKLSIHEEEAKDEESFDPIVQTSENSDDEGNDDASLGMNVGGEEGHDAKDDNEELYRDVNINLEGRDVQMIDVHTTQEYEDIHVTLTLVNPDGQQQIAPLILTAPTLPPPTIPTISQVLQAPTPPTTAPSTFLQDLLNFVLLFGFDHRLKILEANFSEFVQTNQFVGAVSSILGIVERYMDQWINEAVKIAVQIQSDRLQDEAQAENEEFLNNLDENIQKIIKEQVKTSYVVAADLSKMDLKKILIDKMESNKSIHQSNEQRNLYKALVDAYKCDKIILDTYGDTVTLKRRRDDVDKDEEPSVGSDRGTKRRREEKKLESTRAPKEKATKTTSKSTQSDLAKQADSRSSFNEQMDTPVDFSAFLMNRLKVDTLTPELLAGHRVIPFDHFINNDLEYRCGDASSRKYTTSVTKIKAADYGHIKWIEDLSTGSLLEMSTQNVESSLSSNFILLNGIITSIWIGSRKANKSHDQRTLYFQRLSKNVHKKHRHPMACGRSSAMCRKLLKETQPHKAGYVSDGTLNDVRTGLDDHLKGIWIMYLPQAIWRRSDKERAATMI
nr:hypothetical protein [Tanacetum cinerariifolium]